MNKTYQSVTINVPIEKVWETVRDFHSFSWAPNVITSCVKQGDKGGLETGAKRILNDAFHETLLELDEENHRIRYRINEGPSPITPAEVGEYFGELHLLPVTKDNATFVEWSSKWENDSGEAYEFCHGIYVALLDDLAKTMS